MYHSSEDCFCLHTAAAETRGISISRGKLKYRIAFPVTVATVFLLVASTFGSYWMNRQQTETVLREQAYILSQEMAAIWDFAAVNQDRINYDADGEYNFKGLHCSIVGTSVGALFSSRTDYVIRYVSDAPRNPQNQADDFELQAIAAFRSDPLLEEYEGFTKLPQKGDESYYRYAIPLAMNSKCESCHGFPAGEMDVTGFAKEGLENGDLVGVASISIPTAMHDEATLERTTVQVGLGLFVFVGCIATVLFYVTRYVTRPIEKIEGAIQKTGAGEADVVLDPVAIKAKDEVRSLVEHFNETAGNLRALHSSLEDKVVERTEQLATANGRLAEMNAELKEQARYLEEMNGRLEEVDRYKSHYFTMMSHELKTPLTAIKAYTDMLKAMGGVSDAAAAEILSKIQANTTSLTKLVHNILEITRLDDGRVQLERQTVDAVDLMAALGKTLEPLAAVKGVSVYYVVSPNMPLFFADQEKVLHILENLGSNAVKYSPEGETVLIEAVPHWKDSTLRFVVSDNGPGIPEADKDVIFEKFVQARSSMERPVSGSGLGLALAREYAELHGGRIELVSETGQGSAFKVILPYVEPEYPIEGE